MFKKLKERKRQQLEAALDYKKQVNEMDESTIFTKNEKVLMDIVVKCEFGTSVRYHSNINFYFNDLYVDYYYSEDHRSGEYSIYKKEKNSNIFLIGGYVGKAKRKIINDIINDKRSAYVENSIISAFNNKIKNSNDCAYCGTKKEKNRINCINCGAVI